MPTSSLVDRLIAECLRDLAVDPHVLRWRAKERNWVNYFASEYLIPRVGTTQFLTKPSQITIEVAIPQPPGYQKATVCRDLVIWAEPGQTCWDSAWRPRLHPLAIVEWKVHRPDHRNHKVAAERRWLRKYCAWQPSTVAYAVEIDTAPDAIQIACARFLGNVEQAEWLRAPMPRLS